MKKRTFYNIVLNEKIIATSTKIKEILDELKELRKTEPGAYVITYYV